MHECMQINKYHVVALHLTCMGTSRISGVNARHGFEQAVFLRRLSTVFSDSIIGVCTNENIGGLSIIFSKCCPQYYRSLSK